MTADSTGRRRGLALVVAVATVVAGTLTLAWLSSAALLPGEETTSRVTVVLLVTGMLLLTAAGAVITRQQPASVMGRLLLGTGAAGILGPATLALALAADARGSALTPALAWVTNWSWVPGQLLVLLLLLRFPSGALPGRRWRLVEWALIGYAVLLVLVTAAVPGPVGGGGPLGHLDNPLGLEALSSPLNATLGVLFALMPLAPLAALGGLAVQWRRASRPERRQLGWIAAALAFVAVVTVVEGLLDRFTLAQGLAFLLLPATVVAALFRGGVWGAEARRRLDRLRAVREEERGRLRRELHDSLGPLLGSISMRAEAARNLAGDPSRVDAVLESIGRDTETALVEVRRLIDELGPSPLADSDLDEALRAYAVAWADAPTHLSLRMGSLPELDPGAEIAAYRIVGEAVRNAMRHAEATRCDVAVEVEREALVITVRDNGIGLGGRPPGVGRRAMADRAAEVGGWLRVADAPGGGTLVRAELPGATR